MLSNSTIQTRLGVSIFSLVLLILTLALVTSLTLFKTDQRLESVDRKWLASSGMLGELADQISEFRLAETYWALASSKGARAGAAQLLAERRDTVRQIQHAYAELHGKTALAELKPFAEAWNNYLAAHDAWVHSEQVDISLASNRSSLHESYLAADEAIDALIDLNAAKAHREGMVIDSLVHQTLAVVLAVCVIALGTGLIVFIRVRTGVTRPLAHMTEAMHALAQGEREVTVPEQNRSDEIGTLAKAFDVFRGNANALEKAHLAAQVAQEQAQALARHDALTGLPNRRLFNAELELALTRAGTGEAHYLLMMLDLDRFKPINDLQGHAVGDQVLCEVAQRLNSTLKKGDVAARLGGDEFAVLVQLDGKENVVEASAGRADEVLRAIGAPIPIGQGQAEIGASIGLAMLPGDGMDLESLLQAADVAMYRAKKTGRGRYCFFEASMGEELRAQATQEQDLRHAVAHGEIEPYYQPLIDIRASRIYGFEMLARWKHPVHGFIRPDVFIPLAEKLGLIGDLTWSLLRRACRDAAGWDASVNLAVNISPHQLKDASFALQLVSVLNETGFDPRRLEIEITESALVDDIDATKALLAALQQLGIRVALDDFGTGYSSLSHLRDLKFDKVKIDKSFVQAMNHDNESGVIVSAILSLTNSLKLQTVAEGIEDQNVLEKLADMGCDIGQGFYFGKAVTAHDATSFVHEWMATSTIPAALALKA